MIHTAYVSKLAATIAVLAALLIPAVAAAQNDVAARVGPGVQMTCGPNPPTHVSTRGALWCKSTDSNKLYYTDPAGTSGPAAGAGVTFPIANGTNTTSFNYGGPQTGTSTDYSSRSTNPLTTGDKMWSWGGTGELAFLGVPAATTIPELRGVGDNIGMRNSSGTGIVMQGANDLYLYGANATNWHMLANNYIEPTADNAYGFGTSSNRVKQIWYVRTGNGSQNMSFSATPAFDCTAGNHINIGLITANVTGPTMVAGSPGEECTITFRKDATAGTYTVNGWGSNVRFAGTATFTSGSGSLITFTFWWNDRLTTQAWVEKSRAAGN